MGLTGPQSMSGLPKEELGGELRLGDIPLSQTVELVRIDLPLNEQNPCLNEVCCLDAGFAQCDRRPRGIP